jgi:hypothetical protein
MDGLSGGTPTGHALDVGAAAPPSPPVSHSAVLDSCGVIVAADDRWAAAARDPSSTVGALGSVGACYHEACEAEARRRPELRDALLRLASAVRESLAGDGTAAYSRSRSASARMGHG